MRTVALSALLLGCHVDAAREDARFHDTLPARIEIDGITAEQSSHARTPVVGATVSAYLVDHPEAPIATTTTNANGSFTLSLETHGVQPYVYLVATEPGHVDSYFDFAGSLDADTFATVDLLTPATHTAIYTAAGLSEVPGRGTLELIGCPREALMIVPSADGIVYYTDGVPDPTGPGGLCYALGVTAGNVEVSQGNATRTVNVVPDALNIVMVPAPIGGD